MLLTIAAFAAALGVLIAVHEYGHYRVAVACGVKVLRFSIGFGRPLLRWQPKGSPTEFVIGAFPLGGYVRMLDEREAPVAPEERHLAFNTRPLRARAAIVAAGPLANLLLAVLLYAAVNWSGVDEPKAMLSSPVAGSIAQRAGVQGGEQVVGAAIGEDEPEPVRSFEELRWVLTRGALDAENVRLLLQPVRGAQREVVLPLEGMQVREADAQLFRTIGIVGPWTRPVLGEVMAGGAAERAGLHPGDLVLRLGGTDVVDGAQLRDLIRGSVRDGKPLTQVWRVDREGRMLDVTVTPQLVADATGPVGRIGAYVGNPPEMVNVRYGPVEGLWKGVERTWEVSVLTLRMMGRMVIGEASIKNLSGPLTIADYAGRSASMGLTQYLAFLALISVSLGVLNLLPLPVLDGGHLMYYLWEGLTGRSVSEAWMDRLQRTGVVVLLLMMSIALFNDLTRLFG
ncbi:RIP metalloprotease RseP [Alicycliphilus denitrificans]|uniref:Zinc metalloprotease n=2 Tax=Alicycliphilus denitrificans TaxID=179636 RepID=F4GAT0_ALIDK|nr:RIP metalloprotease RseP [Alicycliphilus denitrificans]ADU99231.1 membrane-associated zinc metalloprotease [Alicycliphilus denitrificans BC]AEB85793.1 membrane-associated zinc metalloprotease [Alicycliphilus denitrificans K601]QKD43506.1 RIP metalloprotease RseP [Alicycliphilus denitrificans]GAO27361.1 membrane-associated zinc metalloprotease [Alicycliphilus sp. B1]